MEGLPEALSSAGASALSIRHGSILSGFFFSVCVIFELFSQRDPKDLESLQFLWPIAGYSRDLSSSEVS